jgi:hypothetical protein
MASKGEREEQGQLYIKHGEPAEQPPAIDPKKRLFDLGVSILTSHGGKERGARSFLAKYAQQDQDRLAEVLGYLAINPKVEPQAYIAAAMQPKKRKVVL